MALSLTSEENQTFAAVEVSPADVLLSAATHSSKAIMLVSASGEIVFSNPQFDAIFTEVSDGDETIAAARFAANLLVEGCTVTDIAWLLNLPTDKPLMTVNGHVLNFECQPSGDGGWMMTFEDVKGDTGQRITAASLARKDALTGLGNRLMLREQLEARISAAKRDRKPIALLYLDLDEFKAVNDTLGHPVGDLLLQKVAERIRGAVRSDDEVGRLGGDEFAILLSGGDQPKTAEGLAERLVDMIARPYLIDGNLINIGTSIGIAMYGEQTADADTILKHADLALYKAKSLGRGRYVFFEPQFEETQRKRRTMEQDLRRALALKQFKLVYQPQLNVTDQKITGFEALIRWEHPTNGLIAPLQFIPLAEETGLIHSIGEWVLNQACQTAATWPQAIGVAVNVAPVQFADKRLIKTVKKALLKAGLAPHRLELEITETALFADDGNAMEIIERLREIGVGISMDDFGTGYSSLSQLRKFPFNKIKIDQSFVRGEKGDEGSQAIIRAVTELSKSFGMSTIAEGVETSSQLEWVRQSGCTNIQGFLLSKPIPPGDVAGVLAQYDGSPKKE